MPIMALLPTLSNYEKTRLAASMAHSLVGPLVATKMFGNNLVTSFSSEKMYILPHRMVGPCFILRKI